ncbi:hypothetical protein ECAE60S_01259 [Eoetvoesiella caeni]
MLMAQVEYFEGEIPLRGLLPPKGQNKRPATELPPKGWMGVQLHGLRLIQRGVK